MLASQDSTRLLFEPQICLVLDIVHPTETWSQRVLTESSISRKCYECRLSFFITITVIHLVAQAQSLRIMSDCFSSLSFHIGFMNHVTCFHLCFPRQLLLRKSCLCFKAQVRSPSPGLCPAQQSVLPPCPHLHSKLLLLRSNPGLLRVEGCRERK